MSNFPPQPASPAPPRAPLLGLALVVLVTFAVFFPTLQAGFLDWDEDPLLMR